MTISMENLGFSFVAVFGDEMLFASTIIAYLLGTAIVGIDIWLTSEKRKSVPFIIHAIYYCKKSLIFLSSFFNMGGKLKLVIFWKW